MSIRTVLSHPLTKGLCSIAVLAVAGSMIDWQVLFDAMRRYDPFHLLIAGIAALAILFFLAIRWAVMAAEVAPGEGIRHFRNFLFGICINSVTPANIGSDVYRFATLHRDGQKWRVVGLLVQEKILLLIGYLLTCGAALAWAGLGGETRTVGHRDMVLGAAVLCGLGAAALFVAPSLIRLIARHRLLYGRVAAWLAGLGRLVELGKPRRVLPLIALTLLSIAAWLVAVTAVSRGLNITLSMPLVWLAAIVADMARWAPFSLQGIGVRESAFAGMFLLFGADPSLGFAIGGIAYLMLTLAMIAAGGLAFVVDAAEGLRRGKQVI